MSVVRLPRPGLSEQLLETPWARPHLLVLGVILLIAGLAHGINMEGYPYYENDEGAYISQAWSLIHLGELAPYTYWYDHAPGGWIQIAGWMLLTGGFHTFGNSVATGRVFMLIIQLLSTALVFRIGMRASGKVWVGVLAALAFSLSAYGIYYHRRVLLDNITSFWMLLAIDVLLMPTVSLYRVWISAVALGLSILSKELTAFLVPALGALVFVRTDPRLRWMAVSTWASLGASVVSLYILLAALKGELFPTGTLLGGAARHVSLLCSLQYQGSRGGGGGILNPHSLFWVMANYWAHAEPLLVIGGTGAAIGCVLVMRRRPTVGIIGLCCLSLWLFLARGQVIEFYLDPLLPLLAICLALVAGLVVGLVRNRWLHVLASAACFVAVGAGLALGYVYGDARLSPENLWRTRLSDAQLQAENWVVTHAPDDSAIVMDDSLWTDYHDGTLGRSYHLAHWYWKVELDPEIHDQVFGGDWHRVDYVVTSPQLTLDTNRNGLALVSDTLLHSRPVVTFDSGGWPIQVREVDKSGAVYANTLPTSARAKTSEKTDSPSKCESQ